MVPAEQNKMVKLKSVHKALAVLDCFIDKQPLGVTEISEKLGMYKSNVYDILSTLSAAGYTIKDNSSGKYYLGLSVVRLGRAANSNYSIQKIASEHIRTISRETGEICYLTVPENFRVFYLDIAFPTEGNGLLAASLRNSTDTMNSTGSGKCMLAYMPPSHLEEYLSRPMEKLTENTITEPDALRQELIRIRTRGYAVDNMENTLGICCVAVPLLSRSGNLVGAISVSGPQLRFPEDKVQEFVQILRKHTDEISKYL